MTQQLAFLPAYLTGHLQLTLIALIVATAVSVPLGIVATRIRWLGGPLLALASAIQTIPGLALLAMVVPLLAALALPSIGFLPAIVGLTLYAILPILRNTVTGIEGVDPALTEAARGVGMTAGEQLRRIELPLALPVLVAGLRTATVWTVGMATLSTPVGATSLGNYIFTGLQTRNFAAVLVGSVAAAVLALVLDQLVRTLEVGVTGRRRATVVVALSLLGLLCGYVGFTLLPRAGGASRPIVVGAKTFTEQYILADLLADRLRRDAGLPTRVVPSLGSTVAFDALRAGDIDVYVDYTGTLWATVLGGTGRPPDRAEAIAEVRRYLARNGEVALVAALGFENAYALAMREAEAERRGIRTISELAPFAPSLSIGGDYDFFQRPEWRSIESTYGLRFASQRSMDPSLLYQAIEMGNVDVISAYTTDGRIAALDLRVLVDDRRAIPPYDAVILVSTRLEREAPQAVAALRGLEGRIDAETMRRLNLGVDERGESAADVAADFARRLDAAGATPGPSATAPGRASETQR